MLLGLCVLVLLLLPAAAESSAPAGELPALLRQGHAHLIRVRLARTVRHAHEEPTTAVFSPRGSLTLTCI